MVLKLKKKFIYSFKNKINNAQKIKICPECHSTNIKEDWKLRGTIYECKKCGYRGVLILDVPIKLLKCQKFSKISEHAQKYSIFDKLKNK